MAKAKKGNRLNGQYGPEWGDIRRAMKKRANHRCEACANPGARRKPLQVHHIVPFSKSRDNGHDNLAVLCYPCHLRVHRIYRQYECATARQFRHVFKAAKAVIKAETRPVKRRPKPAKILDYLDRDIVPWAFAG
jgi:hypothetical protein